MLELSVDDFLDLFVDEFGPVGEDGLVGLVMHLIIGKKLKMRGLMDRLLVVLYKYVDCKLPH